jgi:hypothetical protein
MNLFEKGIKDLMMVIKSKQEFKVSMLNVLINHSFHEIVKVVQLVDYICNNAYSTSPISQSNQYALRDCI